MSDESCKFYSKIFQQLKFSNNLDPIEKKRWTKTSASRKRVGRKGPRQWTRFLDTTHAPYIQLYKKPA